MGWELQKENSEIEIKFILKNNIPLIDLRSPSEFKVGAFPSSHNLPILYDEERSLIGKTYKLEGGKAAENLGYRIVSGGKKDKRIKDWKKFIEKNPSAHLYCWRGGKRSKIASEWLQKEGVEIPLIDGGYKTLRRTCLDILNNVDKDSKKWIIIGGRTGSGKTKIIQEVSGSIDLEQLANHRGSAFGKNITPQPTTINFENKLAVSFIQHEHETLILEDESRGIGKLILPEIWYQKMQSADLMIIKVSMEERLENIYLEYVKKPQENHISYEKIKYSIQNSLLNIKNRLGLLNYGLINDKIELAFLRSKKQLHKDWIHSLLINYYDPMYNYQLGKKKIRCIMEGGKDTIMNFLKNEF